MNIYKQPELAQVLKFYQHRGLVGEEKLAILQTLLAIKRVPFGIQSLSGAGKSATADLLVNYKKHGKKILLPEEDIYILGLTSKTAASYDNDMINNSKILYIEELQKAGENLEVTEMLKNLGEGKDSTRLVRDQANRKNASYTINKGLGIIYTLALENDHKTDTEMNRRYIALTTDVSQKQTAAVIKRKGKERFCKKRLSVLTEEELDHLKLHVADCLHIEEFVYENPFAEYISSIMPTPDQKVRSFVDHYFNVVEACTLYHYKDRIVFKDDDGKQHLLLNIQDVIITNLLYSEFFNRDVHSIPPLGIEVLEAFKYIDASDTINNTRNTSLQVFIEKDKGLGTAWASIVDIRNTLKEKQNIILSHKITKDTCDALYNAGYLLKNVGNAGMVEYKVADKIVDFNNNINWEECYTIAKNNVKEFFPEHYDEWIRRQEKDGKVSFVNPISGETEELTKYISNLKARAEATAKDIEMSSENYEIIQKIKEAGTVPRTDLTKYASIDIIDALIINNVLISDNNIDFYINEQ